MSPNIRLLASFDRLDGDRHVFRGENVELTRKAWHRQDILSMLKYSARTYVPTRFKRTLKWLHSEMPYSWRAGPFFRSTCGLLRESQWWAEERIQQYQLARLKEVVRHAGKNVPGYAAKFAEHEVGPGSIATLDDIRRFPCLTKDDLRANRELYVARNVPKERLQYVTSGGTTGAPAGFYHISQYNEDIARAFRLTMWRRICYTPRYRALDLTASFEGAPTEYYRDRNLLYVSISSLGHQHFSSYVDAIRRFRPQFIIGFPSTVTLFAQLVRDYNVSDLHIRAVITASEVLYEPQRRYVSEILGCRILDWYGLAELAGFASGCEHSNEYHFSPEAGYMELLDAHGSPIREEGKEGEIVLTGFYNWATPFIRYRTGDRAILGSRRCDLCGRNYPLLRRIAGRTQEFLVAQNGRLIPNTALNVHSDILDDVLCYQFYQDSPGEVVLNIVRNRSYESQRTEYIRREIQRKLGDDVKLHIRFVEDIPRTSRGKHKFIVQELPLRRSWEAVSSIGEGWCSNMGNRGCGISSARASEVGRQTPERHAPAQDSKRHRSRV